MNGTRHSTMINTGGWCLIIFSILYVGITLLIDSLVQNQTMLYSMENHNLYKVAAGTATIRFLLTVYALTPLLLIPGAVAAFYTFIEPHEANMRCGMYFATAGALALCMSLLMIPSLNWHWLSYIASLPVSGQANNIILLQAVHSYFGVFIGDLLGLGCLLIWFFITSIVMMRSPNVPHSMGVILLILAICSAVVLAFRYTGLVADRYINIQAPGIFALWIFVCGIALISLRRD